MCMYFKKPLSHRTCQNMKRNRAAVSPADMNKYFDELEESFQGVPPHFILNYDESTL